MPFEEDSLPSQPSPNIGNQAFITTVNEESNDDLNLPPKAHRNKSQPFPQPTSQRAQSSKNLERSQSSHLRKLPSVPPVPTSSQPKKKRKRRAQSPIGVESDSDNERSSYKNRQKEKLSMAEAVVERKRIDAKIQKKDQELRAAQADRSKRDAQRRHELYLFELENQRIEARNQAEERKIEAEKRREEAKQRTLQLQLQLATLLGNCRELSNVVFVLLDINYYYYYYNPNTFFFN